MSQLARFYRGKRVFVTGHTGFKGSWLTLWLEQMGAEVRGYSLDVPTQPSHFQLAGLADRHGQEFANVLNRETLNRSVEEFEPEILFHLAAQPLVRLSYDEPLLTLDTNVSGTANVLEAVRRTGKSCTIVVATSDKCYENVGQVWGYRECDPMGGYDPYSMSKGAAELVVQSWRRSYFSDQSSPVRLASARAGNVVGGGDWAIDRLMTDCVAALTDDRPIVIRNPLATRPWQHVLEPLSGYLWLALKLATAADPTGYASGWNFGPPVDSVRPVEAFVSEIIAAWGSGSWQLAGDADAPHEALALGLNCDKAHHQLKWRPVWDFSQTIQVTADWYVAWNRGDSDIGAKSLAQIARYEADAIAVGVEWARNDRPAQA